MNDNLWRTLGRSSFPHRLSGRLSAGMILLFSLFCLFFPAQVRSQDRIKIAAIFATSGIAAPHNAAMIQMTELAVHSLNRGGGLLDKEVELIVIDNESTPIGAALAAQQAVDMGVTAVIGAHWSSHSLAMAAVLQKAGIPMISPASTNPEITRGRDFVFRVCFLDSVQGRAMAKFVREDLGFSRAVTVSNVDEEYSLVLASFFKKAFEEKQGTVAEELYYRGDATDFTSILLKIKEMNPEIIYLPGYTRDSGLFIRQARKMGVKSVFLGGDAWDEIAGVTGDAINGSYQTAAWHPMVNNTRSRKLQRLFQQEIGHDIKNYSSPLAFDAVMALAEAIRQCSCLAGEGIRDALLTMKPFRGVTGTFKFDENGDPLDKELIILQFKEGSPVFVKALLP